MGKVETPVPTMDVGKQALGESKAEQSAADTHIDAEAERRARIAAELEAANLRAQIAAANAPKKRVIDQTAPQAGSQPFSDPVRTGPRPTMMWSPKAGGTHIGLTNGHTLFVPNDPEHGVEVRKMFRKRALIEGCLMLGMEAEEEDADEGGFKRAAVIQDKMKLMMDSDDPTYFTPDHKPSTGKLSALCGFPVSQHERNVEWATVERSLGVIEPDGD